MGRHSDTRRVNHDNTGTEPRFSLRYAAGTISAVAVLALLPSADRVAAQAHTLADAAICFALAERCTGQIVAALNGAGTETRVQAFAFSSRPITTALVAADQRGADLQTVLDRSNRRFHGGVLASVTAAGIPTFIDWRPAIAHSKVMIVDRHLVISGLFNYSASADTRNAETVTFMDTREVTGCFLAN